MPERRIAEGGFVLSGGPGGFITGVVLVLGVEGGSESHRVDANRYTGVRWELVAKAMEEGASEWEPMGDAMRMHCDNGYSINSTFSRNKHGVLLCPSLYRKLQSDTSTYMTTIPYLPYLD